MLRSKSAMRTIEVQEILKAAGAEDVQKHVEHSLVEPISSIGARPSKRIRNHLVDLSFALAMDNSAEDFRWQEWRSRAGDLLENIHLASLIVDDIQDGSAERRGGPALHLEYGLPLALNAGNSLYFWELWKLQQFGLPSEQQNRLMQRTLRMFVEAHLGQACDVGNRIREIPQEEVAAVSLSTMKLKTGALSGYALSLGAFLLNVPEDRLLALDQMGRRFGVALQMFDDVGPDPRLAFSQRQQEDLQLQRLSWLMAIAANSLGAKEYKQVVDTLDDLPGQFETVLAIFHENKIWLKARSAAEKYLAEALGDFQKLLPMKSKQSAAFTQLKELAEVLKEAYAKL